MELRLGSELETQLRDHAEKSGVSPEDIVSGLVQGYLDEAAEINAMLDRRIKAIESGEATLIDGEEAFRLLRSKLRERISQNSTK